VSQFVSAWIAEAEELTPLRIDAGHHMLDFAIFPCGGRRLKNNQVGHFLARGRADLAYLNFRPIRLCPSLQIVRVGFIDAGQAYRAFLWQADFVSSGARLISKWRSCAIDSETTRAIFRCCQCDPSCREVDPHPHAGAGARISQTLQGTRGAAKDTDSFGIHRT
jgi:hypothetical protein